MTTPRITADEALRMAREAIDDKYENIGCEKQLARFVVDLLESRATLAQRVNPINGAIVVSDHHPKMDGSDVKFRLSARHATALAAALLRAADAAERKDPTDE